MMLVAHFTGARGAVAVEFIVEDDDRDTLSVCPAPHEAAAKYPS